MIKKKVQINWYTTSCVLAHVFQFQEDHFKLAMILTCLRLCNPLDGALHLYKLTLHNFSLEVSAQDRVYAHDTEKKIVWVYLFLASVLKICFVTDFIVSWNNRQKSWKQILKLMSF